MRKDESLDLLKNLSQSRIDTSQFRPSSKLGRRTRASIKAPDLEHLERHFESGSNEARSSRETTDTDDSGSVDGKNTVETLSQVSEESLSFGLPKVIGSGLKRPHIHDSSGIPSMKKRQRMRTTSWAHLPAENPDETWEGFSSISSFGVDSSTDASETESIKEEKHQTDYGTDSGADDSSRSTLSIDGNKLQDRKQRASAFKAWASQQVNEAAEFAPSANPSTVSGPMSSINGISMAYRPPEIDPLPPELEVTTGNLERKVYSIQVQRPQEIQESRNELPIVTEEQRIMESIYNNQIVIICGATGSGKTTQIPQFLYEAGFGDSKSPYSGMIGITQPRRVAAVSMAKRVQEELGNLEGKVSYQIRFDSTTGTETAIKFMTDGILVREIGNDFLLSKYAVVIIDEAHERSTNTDVLIGLVSRIVDLRESMSKEDENVKPLKLIIMSANLRISDFMENSTLFRSGPPPLLQIEGRQFPVTVHFARRTGRDYLEEAYLKICKGHRKLPPGGMLIFLTGQNEIEALSRRLKETLANSAVVKSRKAHVSATELPLETEDLQQIGGLQNASYISDEEELLDEEGEEEDFEIEESESPSSRVEILPLFSQLQTNDQLRVFQTPPKDTRLIILSTNVAETSITIPGIRYVFDCGRAKEKKHDQVTGVQSFEIGWISKASASQRAGRAGRTAPGHCYRLYSSAVYERDFEEHAEPEILRMPAEGIILQLKSMGIDNVVNFPFPTPPDRQALANAERLLASLGAISKKGKLTTLGRDISKYPLSPRFAKILAIGHQHGCMPYTIGLVASLATPDIFLPENIIIQAKAATEVEMINSNKDRLAEEEGAKRQAAHRQAHHSLSTHSSTSDAIKSLTALCAYAYSSDKLAFCQQMFLSSKAISEASSLSSQLISMVHNIHPGQLPIPRKAELSQLGLPSKNQISALQQFVAAAFIDQVAIRAEDSPETIPDTGRRPKRASDVPYLPLFPIHPVRTADMDVRDVAIYIHPSSLLAQRPVKELPTYIIYRHLQRQSPSLIGDASSTIANKTRTRMHPLTTITGRQLAHLARNTSLLEYGKPIGKVEEMDRGRRRVCWVVPSLVNGMGGGVGWPLPAVKVIQSKEQSVWEVSEVVG